MASNATPSATCGLCSELYTDPRMLNCLHSFCKKCILKLFEEQGVSKACLKCPTCNELSSIPEQGVNFYAKDHRKSYEADIAQYEASMRSESPIPCDQCVRTSKSTAVSFCCTCCEFLCEMCSDHHRSWRKTLDHELVKCKKGDSRESALKSIPHKPLHCGEHSDETLKFYCETCSCLLCRDCVMLKHKDHKYDRMEMVADKEKSELVSVEMFSVKHQMSNRLQHLLAQFEKCSFEPCKQEIIHVSLESHQLEKDIAGFGAVMDVAVQPGALSICTSLLP